MKKLLSLPPNLVACFHEVERADRKRVVLYVGPHRA